MAGKSNGMAACSSPSIVSMKVLSELHREFEWNSDQETQLRVQKGFFGAFAALELRTSQDIHPQVPKTAALLRMSVLQL